jgi:hypothetical protein
MTDPPRPITQSLGYQPRCWRCEAFDWDHVEEIVTPDQPDVLRPWHVFRCRQCGARTQTFLYNGELRFGRMPDE